MGLRRMWRSGIVRRWSGGKVQQGGLACDNLNSEPCQICKPSK
jgi:hypothetical protein